LAAESRIPKLLTEGNAGAVRSLPLAPVDGFVLSRIDGRASERELASLTGLPEAQVRSSLDKLESLKVISFAPATTGTTSAVSPPPRPNPAAQAAASRPSPRPDPTHNARPPQPRAPSLPPQPSTGLIAPGSPRPGSSPPQPSRSSVPPVSVPTRPPPASSTPNARVVAAIAAVADDASELAEDIDLPLPLRRRVLGMHAVLGELDYYALLGVERTAEKKAIKRAYFELAALFHPDKYFRKRLGSFKMKMETIFGRVTQAYDTLQAKDGKKEYDLYLVDLDRTRGIDEMLQAALVEMQRAEEDALRSAEQPSMAPSPPLVAEPSRASSPELPPLAPGPPPSLRPAYTPPHHRPNISVPTPPPISDQLRRDTLAMRLRGGRTGSMRAPSPNGSRTLTGQQRSADAVEALRRRFEERVAIARKAQVDRYVALAEESAAKNDIVAAANAYRVAVTFAKADDPMRIIAAEIIAKADEQLAETYIRQAAYEERGENWPDAAKHWDKVVKARPHDAHALDRLAYTMAKANFDLHEAEQYAQKAVGLDPQNADYRITLATIYISAGLLLAARRELEGAAQLAPGNATIRSVLKRLKAG
jgi:curved DNA-binding protein CbpA